MPIYLSTTEAAKRLGRTRRGINLLIKKGRLKAIPLGQNIRGTRAQPAAWMIDERDVEEFAAQQEHPTGAGRKHGEDWNGKEPKQSKPSEARPPKLPSYQELIARRKRP